MQILILRNDEQQGPYSEDEVRQHLAQGSLLPSDMAWHEGLDGWVALSEIVGAPKFKAPPPPPTVSSPSPATKKSQVQPVYILVGLALLAAFFFGSKHTGQLWTNSPLSVIPDKKPYFQTIIFTEPKSGNTLTLISEKECEIKSGHDILLADYTRQENKLRVVERALGTAMVVYFDILPEGVRQSTTGEMYFLPEPLKRYRDQYRAAQEAEQNDKQ